MSQNNTIITIDGPAGAGKGTVAKLLAEKTGYFYLDTGAMYRTVALALMQKGLDIEKESGLEDFLINLDIELKTDVDRQIIIFLNGSDISDRIRTPDVSLYSSKIATNRQIRKYLVGFQRETGSRFNLIAEGRDMGTYVFPEAKFKFYLDADVEERAKRRLKQIKETDPLSDIDYDQVLKDIIKRDKHDMEREESPLHTDPNAVIIDTTSLTPSEVVVKILEKLEVLGK